METFVRVTRFQDDAEVWVSLKQVESMTVTRVSGDRAVTILHLNRESFAVSETPLEILESAGFAQTKRVDR